MPICYENRRGEKHYVKAVKTKKGGTRYYIVKNNLKREELIDEIPPGFEFYEFPEEGLVAFRKIRRSNITDQEFSILESVMKQQEDVQDFIIDKEENALMVYISDYDNELLSMLTDEQFRQMQRFNEKLRFEKTKDILFQVQRFCYLSKFYGWITMETSEDLKYLGEKYCPHINKESLMEFWIEGEEEPEATLVGELNGIRVFGFGYGE